MSNEVLAVVAGKEITNAELDADACAPGNPKDASVEDLKELFRKLM